MQTVLYEFPPVPLESEENMASAAELTTELGKLEERVANHIKFFWVVVGFGFVWLGVLTGLLYQTKTSVNGIAKVEANTPAQIVAALLNNPVTTEHDAQENLAAAASVLQTAKIGKVRPDPEKLKAISDRLIDDQSQYPEMPQVWQTTGVFINYKFQVLLPSVSERTAAVGKNCHQEASLPGAFHFEGCEVSLEDLASKYSHNTDNGKPVPFQFINCIVHYSGGALPDGPMEFSNSILVFQITAVPPRNATKAMQQLEQADVLDHITLQG